MMYICIQNSFFVVNRKTQTMARNLIIWGMYFLLLKNFVKFV